MSENKIKHSSVIKMMRRKFSPNMVMNIITRFDMSPRVGCLPPQLVPLVPRENRANVTNAFGQCLEQFLLDNKQKIINLTTDTTFDVPDISALFNTQCVIHARGFNVYGVSPWAGCYGIVCKVSFPTIKAEYALKFFVIKDRDNNPLLEISAAFGANHAEPRHNCPIYMASLNSGNEFMLSQWAGDVADGKIRENKYEIYYTNEDEMKRRNLRNGRRIDYGETLQTDYGRASFRVRKMFRKVMHAANMGYDAEIEYMYQTAKDDNERKNLVKAMKLAWFITFMDDKYRAMDVIERNMNQYLR